MLCESVTAFVPDKDKALSEYRRAVKPGGYVGLNEGTWVKRSAPAGAGRVCAPVDGRR